MQTPEKYREYAKECRRIALLLPSDQRAALLEIADAWIRCAEEEERRTEKK